MNDDASPDRKIPSVSATEDIKESSRRPETEGAGAQLEESSVSGGPDLTGVEVRAIENFSEVFRVTPGDKLGVAIESFVDTEQAAKAGIVRVVARDAKGHRIPIPEWHPMSSRFYEFVYLSPGTEREPATYRFDFEVPEGAVEVELQGHRWKREVETTIVGSVKAHVRGQGAPPFRSDSGKQLAWPADWYSESIRIPTSASSMDVSLLVEATTDCDAKSPLSFEFLDAEGQLILPSGEMAVSLKHGTFVYLEAREGEQQRNDLSVDLPPEARSAHISGIAWNARTARICEHPEVSFRYSNSIQAVVRHLSDVRAAEAESLYVIDSTAPPLGDETKRLRPNNLAYEFAQRGTKVLFIPFGSTQGLDYVVTDNLAQIDRSHAPEVIESLIGSTGTIHNVYMCTSFPSLENVARAEYLKRHGWTVVYEVRDDMEEFNRVGYSKWYNPLLERRMLALADRIATVSHALSRKMQVLAPAGADIRTVPNGVTRSTVDSAAALRDQAHLEARENSTIVGYVGHLTPSWFDWPVLIEAAKALPDLTFEIIGHGMPAGQYLPPNMEFLGAMTHEEIRPIAGRWKTGLIPFIPTPLTRGVDPNKIYEYFAWGLRVVSAPMGSVDSYPSTWVYRTRSELVAAIRESVSSPMSSEELQALADFAEASKWENRAVEMAAIMKGEDVR